MIIIDSPNGAADRAPLPATLLPLVYDPDTGRVFWLDPDRRIVSSPVAADGHTSLAAAAAIPLPDGADERIDVVAVLLHDIADVTGRPLPVPIAAPPADGHDEYIVVWVDNSYQTRTARQAAEQAWRTMRRAGSHACVFQVVNRRTGARVEVDLLDDEPGTEAGNPS
jgi:hypothetical protein